MHAIMIPYSFRPLMNNQRLSTYVLSHPYDMIHIIMYAQELVRAKGLKEQQTWLSFLLLLTIINIHILTCI